MSSWIVGVDEVGRGPLAGPVVAAAVVFKDVHTTVADLADSKALSAKKRKQLHDEIIATAHEYAIVEVSAARIDEINILQATLEAMSAAVHKLHTANIEKIMIDGNMVPRDLAARAKAYVKGDSKYPIISAASILAKVYRDKLMCDFAVKYPQYGFAQHKGYGTKAHLEAIAQHGVCDLHRRSFAPIKNSYIMSAV